MGSREQRKGALFYIGPYISKNLVQIIDSFDLIIEAQEHATKYPSVADDRGTQKRYVQHVMTRVLNKMSGLMEVSDTQAAPDLLRMNAGVCSNIFTSCDMAAYVQEVMQRTEQQKHAGAHDLSEESDNSSVDSDASDEEALDDTAAESTIAEDCPFEHSIGRSENCKLYKVDNGEKYIPVPYASLYRNRGEGLKALNRY